MMQQVIVFALFDYRHCAVVSLSFAVKKPKPEMWQAYKRFRIGGVEGREQNEKWRTQLWLLTAYV